MSTAATGDAPLFQPLEIGALPLRNRIAVAPMTRVSADAEGHATDAMADYYTAFARGGFGLVIAEGIYTDNARSQGCHPQGTYPLTYWLSYRKTEIC